MSQPTTTQPTAVITGGSRGIGLAAAQRLLADGFSVVVLSRPTSTDPDFTELVESGAITFVAGDIASAEARAELVETALEKHGRIDLLFNNAGMAPLTRLDILDMTEESYDRVMDVNLRAPMFLTQRVARVMIEQEPLEGRPPGMIVNTGSASANFVSTNRGEYCLSKAGVSMMTKLFAVRLAPHGIPVFEVSPGVIKTEMTKVVTEKYDTYIAEGHIPVPRWGMPADVAEAVALLAEGRLAYSTGDIIYVDGGMRIPVL